jgi:hypothetical protein
MILQASFNVFVIYIPLPLSKRLHNLACAQFNEMKLSFLFYHAI